MERPDDLERHLISIHALREEGDTLRRCGSSLASRFLSTPSARRATCPRFILFYRVQFLSTPSARRATTHPEPTG